MTLAFEYGFFRPMWRDAAASALLVACLAHTPNAVAQEESDAEPLTQPADAGADPGQPSAPNSTEPDPVDAAGQEDPHIRAAARSLAAQGAAAFEQGQFNVALDFFQRASVLVQAPTIVVMEARTLAQLGRLIEALDKYETAQRFPLPSNASDAFRQAVLAAGDEGQVLRARIPQLNISIEGPTPDRRVEVWLDERKIQNVLIGVQQPVNPGAHLIEVRGSGFDTIFREVELAEGVKRKVVIELPLPQTRKPAPAPPPPMLVRTLPVKQPSGLSQRTFGWVALGVGGAATVGGVVTGLVALSRKAELDDVCSPGCPPGYADDISTFRTHRTLSYLSFGLGLVAASSGAYLVLTDRPREPQVGLSLYPAGARLKGAF